MPRFRRLDFSSIWAPSAIRSRAVRRNFVCDPRAVASCAITSICIRIPGLSSTSSILPPPPSASTLSHRFIFRLFLSFFFFFLFPRPTLSAVPVGYVSPLFPFLSLSLLVAASSLLFAPRAFGHSRTPTNLPVVPIKSVWYCIQIGSSFRVLPLRPRSSLPRRSLDRSSSRFVAH